MCTVDGLAVRTGGAMAWPRAVVLVLGSVLALGLGCAAQRPVGGVSGERGRRVTQGAVARRGPVPEGAAVRSRRYVDAELGFELVRLAGNWQLEMDDEVSAEGLSVPVVLRQKETGAQVVLQVAPAVATPRELAERLTQSLRSHPGFSATDPEPLPLAEGAVGFHFALGKDIAGRVAVLDGRPGQVLMLMGTWPANAPLSVAGAVDEVFGGLRALPREG